MELQVGSDARLKNLWNKQELNGCIAKVVKFLDNGRIAVTLSVDQEAKMISVERRKLECLINLINDESAAEQISTKSSEDEVQNRLRRYFDEMEMKQNEMNQAGLKLHDWVRVERTKNLKLNDGIGFIDQVLADATYIVYLPERKCLVLVSRKNLVLISKEPVDKVSKATSPSNQREYDRDYELSTGWQEISEENLHGISATVEQCCHYINRNNKWIYPGFQKTSVLYDHFPSSVIFLRPKTTENSTTKGLNLLTDWEFVEVHSLPDDGSEMVVLSSYRCSPPPFRNWKLNGKSGHASDSAFEVLRFCWIQKFTVWIDCLSIPLSGHSVSEALSYMGALYCTFPVVCQLLWKVRDWEEYLMRGWIQQETLLTRLVIPEDDSTFDLCGLELTMEQICLMDLPSEGNKVFRITMNSMNNWEITSPLTFSGLMALHRSGLLLFYPSWRPFFFDRAEQKKSVKLHFDCLTSGPGRSELEKTGLRGRLTLEYQRAAFTKEEDRVFGIFGAYCALFNEKLSLALLSPPLYSSMPRVFPMLKTHSKQYTLGFFRSNHILYLIPCGIAIPSRGLPPENLYAVAYAYRMVKTNAACVVVSLVELVDEMKPAYRCAERLVCPIDIGDDELDSKLYFAFTNMLRFIHCSKEDFDEMPDYPVWASRYFNDKMLVPAIKKAMKVLDDIPTKLSPSMKFSTFLKLRGSEYLVCSHKTDTSNDKTIPLTLDNMFKLSNDKTIPLTFDNMFKLGVCVNATSHRPAEDLAEFDFRRLEDVVHSHPFFNYPHWQAGLQYLRANSEIEILDIGRIVNETPQTLKSTVQKTVGEEAHKPWLRPCAFIS